MSCASGAPRAVLRSGLGTLAVLLGLGFAAPASALAPPPDDPAPGANGTVKIDGAEVDDGPSNEPHVECEFAVQYFGFDRGIDSATNEFLAWEPTGNGQPLTPVEGRNSFRFLGGAPGETLNHTERYRLDTTGITPNSSGEIHVRLNARVVDAGGKVFSKHKEFWLRPCTSPSPRPRPTIGPRPPEPPGPGPTPTDQPTPTPPGPEPTPTPTPTGQPTPTPTAGRTPTPAPSESPAPGSTTTEPPGPTSFPAGAADGGGSGGPPLGAPLHVAGVVAGLAGTGLMIRLAGRWRSRAR